VCIILYYIGRYYIVYYIHDRLLKTTGKVTFASERRGKRNGSLGVINDVRTQIDLHLSGPALRPQIVLPFCRSGPFFRKTFWCASGAAEQNYTVNGHSIVIGSFQDVGLCLRRHWRRQFLENMYKKST